MTGNENMGRPEGCFTAGQKTKAGQRLKVVRSTKEQFDPSVHGGQARSNGLMCSNNNWS